MSNGVTTSPIELSRERTGVFAVGWAAAGAAILLLQIYIYGAWILAGQALPVDPGSDPVPHFVRLGIWAFEAANLVTFAVTLVWMIRSVSHTRTFTVFQLLMIGWLFTYWQDPWLSARFPIFTYNAYAYNLGCWCQFLPGWSTPNGSRLPEPLLLNIPAYFAILPAASLPGLVAIRSALRRWPALGVLGRFAAAFGGVLIAWIPLEIFSTALIHIDIWPGSIRNLSFWGGKFYEIPFYEFLFFPAIVTGCSMLLHSAERGPSFVERGLARSFPSATVRECMRVLAVVAYANLMNAIYIGLMVIMSLRADPWPATPSWFRGELCGTGPGFCDAAAGNAPMK